jgi:hypothetical protein
MKPEAIKAGVNVCLYKHLDEFSEMLKQELGYFWQVFEK